MSPELVGRLRVAALSALAAGAPGAVGLMLDAGRHNRSRLLLTVRDLGAFAVRGACAGLFVIVPPASWVLTAVAPPIAAWLDRRRR